MYFVILIGNIEDPTFWLGKVDDFGIRFDLLSNLDKIWSTLVATNQDVQYFSYQNVGSSRILIRYFSIFIYENWIRYESVLVATNQDVLLFKLLTFIGVLLIETCF